MRNSYWLIGILVIGFLLRLINLDQSLWLDEATSVLVARDMSWSEIISRFSPGDFHPPLYYLLLNLWIKLFGSTEVVVRMLSVLFGVGTVALVWFIGKKLFGQTTAILSSLFLATAPLHIYYSQEARMYIVETFLATLLLSLFVNLLRNQDLKTSADFVIVTTLLLYTDYLPGFLLIAFVFYLLCFERKLLPKLLIIFASVTFFYLPWIPTLFKQIAVSNEARQNAPLWWEVLGRTDLKQLALVPIKFIIGRISFFNKMVYGLYVISALAVFLTPVIDTYKQWKKTKFLWFALVIPIVLAAILGSISSGFSYFRLLFVLPVFYLLVAVGSQQVNNKGFQRVTILLVLIVNFASTFIYLLNPRLHREDWRSAVKFIEEKSKGTSAISIFVTDNQRDPYLYYSKSVKSQTLTRCPERAHCLQSTPLKFDRLWLFRYVQPIFDPDDWVRKSIEKFYGYKKVGEYDFNGIVVWEYQKN